MLALSLQVWALRCEVRHWSWPRLGLTWLSVNNAHALLFNLHIHLWRAKLNDDVGAEEAISGSNLQEQFVLMDRYKRHQQPANNHILRIDKLSDNVNG